MIERRSLHSKIEFTGNRYRKEYTVGGVGEKGCYAVLITFFLTAFLLVLLYVVLGFYPFGTNSVIISDLSAQYAPDLIAYKNQVMSGDFSSYSFLIGMGKNVFGLFAYYLASPINMVTFLFPTTMISEAILVLISIKLSLAASFMTLFLRRRFQPVSQFAILFGIMYSFSSYSMIFMFNIMWLDGFLLLPLLLVFVEQFLEDKKLWWRLSLALFVLFVSGFYIAYMVGIFSFMYLLVRLFEDYKFAQDSVRSTRKSIGIFLGSALIAAGLSAAILLPAGIDIISNSDQSAEELTIDSTFGLIDFLNQLLAGSFDHLSNNKPLIYCGLAAFFLCTLFFLNPHFSRRQKKMAGGSLAFFVLSLNLSLLNFAWQLFDAPNWFLFRYSFLVVFVVLHISYASLLHIKKLKGQAFVSTGILFLILLIIVQRLGDLSKEGDRFYVNLLIGVLQLLCLYAMTGIDFPASIDNLKQLVPVLLAILICIEVVYVNPLYIRPKMLGAEIKREHLVNDLNQADDLVTLAKEDSQKDSVAFFRMETDRSILLPFTAGLYFDYYSTSFFTSSAIRQNSRFMKQLGFFTNFNYAMVAHTYSSIIPDSLLGIRYILSDKKCVAGYELMGTSDDGQLFLQKNSQALPLMYLVESNANLFSFFRNEKNPENKNLFVFQNELLISLFGKTAFSDPVYYEALSVQPVIYNAIIKENEPKPEVVLETESETMADTSLASKSTPEDSDHLGEEPVGKELEYGTSYLRINPKDKMSLTYTLEITSKDPLYISVPAVARNSQADVYLNGVFLSDLSSSAYSQILSLGSYEPGEAVTVSLRADTDTYSILPAQFYYCNTSLFKKELARAMQDKDIWITMARDGYISAQITAPDDQLLLTTIPYEKGWTLWVDSVRTDIIPYQGALISVPVSEGIHSLSLSYTAPGMWIGAVISGASVLVFFGGIIFTYKKRR